MRLMRVLNVGGSWCAALGGIFTLFALGSGRYARRLAGAKEIGTLTELRYLFAAVPLLVAVTGRVWAPKPLRCELSEGEGAIVVVLEERAAETRSQDTWLPSARTLRHYTREVPWALADGVGPFAVHLPVQDAGRAGFGDGSPLAVSADQFLPANEGLVEVVVSELMGQRLLGFRKREHYLPQGAEVTVVGELSLAGGDSDGSSLSSFRTFKDEQGRALVLRAPGMGAPFLVSTHPLPRLIADAQRFSLVAGRLGSGFLVTGAMMLALALHLRWQRARQEAAAAAAAAAARARLEAARAAARAAGGRAAPVSQEEDGDEEEGDERRGICVVCYEHAARMVYPRCGHLCLCERCKGSLGATAERCPICRERGPPIKVFLA